MLMPTKLTTRAFIEKARTVHGERYDYSKVEYIHSRASIIVVCSKHGEFNQIPDTHLRSIAGGCKKCSAEQNGIRTRSSIEDFIEKAKGVHGNYYDYSQSVYETNNSKLIIICPEHGAFMQTPSSHCNDAQGCPQCGSLQRGWNATSWQKAQKGRKAILYIIELKGEAELFYKIGITFDLSKRYRTGMPYAWRTIALCKSYDAVSIYNLELSIKLKCKEVKYAPVLPFGGQTECYSSILPVLNLLPLDTFFLKNREIK